MLLVTGLSFSRLCVYVDDGDNHERVFELKVVAVENRGRVNSLRLMELNSHPLDSPLKITTIKCLK